MKNIKTFENYEEASVGGWAPVDGYENLPVGKWLVQLEEESSDSLIHVAVVSQGARSVVAIIGSQFAFDRPKVVAYMPLPNPS